MPIDKGTREDLNIAALGEKLAEDIHKANLLLRLNDVDYEAHEKNILELVKKHNERVFLIIDQAYENSKKN